MKRAAVLLISALLVTLLLGGWLLVETTGGSRWLLERLARLAPVEITLGTMEGRLADRIELREVEVVTEEWRLRIRDLTLDWSPWSLPIRTVQVKKLDVGDVALWLLQEPGPTPPAKALPFSWPVLPDWLAAWKGSIDQLQVARFRLEQPGADNIDVERIGLGCRLENGLLSLTELTAGSAGYILEGEIDLGLTSPQLKGVATLRRSGGPTEEMYTLEIDLSQRDDGAVLTGDVSYRAVIPDWPSHRLNGMVRLSEDHLELSDMTLAREDAAGTVTGAVRFAPGDRWQATVDLALHGVSLEPETGMDLLLDGNLNGTGDPDDWLGEIAVNVTGIEGGEGHLAGQWHADTDRLLVDIERGAWLGGALTGSVRTAWADGATAIEVTARRLDPARIDPGWSGFVNLAGRIEIDPSPETTEVRFDAGFSDSMLRGLPLSGTAKGSWHDSGLVLEELDLSGDRFSLQAKGDLEKRLSFELGVEDLGGVLPGSSGKMHGRGWFAWRAGELLADLTAEGDAVGYRDLVLDRVTLALLRTETAKPYAARIEAGASSLGEIRFNGWQADLSGFPARHDLTFAVEPEGGSRIGLAASGQLTAEQWRGSLTELRLDLPPAEPWRLDGPADLVVGPTGVEVDRLRLIQRDGEFSLRGNFAPDGFPRSLRASARNLPLTLLNPVLGGWEARGLLDADVTCETASCQLRASGLTALEHDGKSLAVQEIEVGGEWGEDGLHSDLTLGLGSAGRLAARVASTRPLQYGWPDQGRLTLLAEKLHPEALLGLLIAPPVSGELSGDFSAEWLDRRPTDLSLSFRGPLTWNVPKIDPVTLELDLGGEWHGGELKLRGEAEAPGQGRFDFAAGANAPPQWDLPAATRWSLQFSGVPLATVVRPLPPLTTAGVWRGRAEGVLLEDLSFTANGSAEVVGGRLGWHDEDAGETSLDLQRATLGWQWEGAELRGHLALGLGPNGTMDADWQLPFPARLPVSPRSDGELHARLAGELKDTGILGKFFPELAQETTGDLLSDARLAGTWGEPTWHGNLRLQNATAFLPAPGIRLKDVGLNAEFERDRVTTSGLVARSGKGNLSGDGELRLRGWEPVEYKLNVTGENFTLIHLPELQAKISPNLHLSGIGRKLLLEGEIAIPEFLASGREVRNPVPVSADVVIVDAEPEVGEKFPFSLTTRVSLVLGKQVLVKLFGLDARLGGKLELTGIDPQHFSGRGEIRVEEGNYSTYGVKLKIENGRAVYAGGPLDNPAIDILALRRIGEIQAGVQVRGTAKKPESKLYSVPAMPDTDILSYIVLGQPVSESGGQTDPLMLAASALLSAGDSAVLRSRLNKTLGIDTIETESKTGETTDTILRLGKYLTPNLYLSYGYSLFNQQSEVGLRYRLLENWEAESKFGTESGADLYYRFEFE